MNKIKIVIILVTISIFTFVFKTNVQATTSQLVEITSISSNQTNQTIKFNVYNNVSADVLEYGIILSRYNEELTLDNNELYLYSFSQTYTKKYSISIKIPDYAAYQNIYAVAYVKTKNEVIYSDKVYSSYAKLSNLDKVVINDIKYENNALIFNMSTTLENNVEYGLIFSKNQLITNLSLENAENDQFETEIIKLNTLNENNQFNVTIDNIPIYELDTTFKVCSYVKNLDTQETYYTNTVEFNILDIYYNDIINNIEINYNASSDGIRFKTSTICYDNAIIGFVFINTEVDNLDINTHDAYIVDIENKEDFAVTIANIPNDLKDQDIYAVSYIKFLNENNDYEYYYSDIYKENYNEIKETYLTNNS